MKRYSIVALLILFAIISAGVSQAEAYSVTLHKDGLYAEALPESVVNNSSALFKKNVEKAMKYYHKYKDADDYTMVTEVPDVYRDFIPVAKKVQDSDEITIRNPFYIYDIMGDVTYHYYFVAERNGKKLCIFSIAVDPDTGKTSFCYDKLMDRYFKLAEEGMEEALFYIIDGITYAQTPEKTSVARNQTDPGGEMDGSGSEAEGETFQKKSYDKKKEEIFAYLNKIKKGAAVKKSGENLKLELKEEYIEPEQDAGDGRMGKGTFAVIGMTAIGVAAGVIVLRNRRKKAQRGDC